MFSKATFKWLTKSVGFKFLVDRQMAQHLKKLNIVLFFNVTTQLVIILLFQ